MAKFIPSKIEDRHDYAEYKNVRIPMRDGVEISANILFPAKDGVVDFNKKYSVIMSRSAYMDVKETMFPNQMGYFCTEHDFVVLFSGVRGTHLSDGEFNPMVHDTWGARPGDMQDGLDVIQWILRQPWSNGKIATCGHSYLGTTQYGLWFSGEVEGLETSIINSPGMNSFGGGVAYAQDFLDASAMVAWSIANLLYPNQYKRLPEEVKKAVEEDCIKVGDLRNHPELLMDVNFFLRLQQEYSYKDMPIARFAPFYQKWLDNRDNPSYFAYNDALSRKHDMNKPIMFVTGWFDSMKMNAINGYIRSVQDAPSEEISSSHRLIVGPWNHEYNAIIPLRRFPEGETDQRLFHMEWFEQQLNGVTSEFFRDNRVSIFVMGENRWRSEASWPLADEVRTRLYLHSGGAANTRLGNGVLSAVQPERDETADHYRYDPADPVISYGGISVFAGGMADQRFVELRPDVLVYTTDVLEEGVEVTGNVTGTVFAATSATDTDFFMKLLDVGTDGTVYNVVAGGRRGRYIKNGRTNPEALVPGEINKYQIDLRSTSYVFKKGHQIRVEISSSDSLLCEINPNAFVDLNTCTKEDFVIADQTIYHDAEHMSYIELPIIPADRERDWIEWPFHASLTGVDWLKNGYDSNPPTTEYAGSEYPFN